MGSRDSASGKAGSGSTGAGAGDPGGELSHADTMATPLSGASDPGEASDSIVGELLGERYQVTRRIGKGGMGAVYEATHVKIGKRVAIKILLDKYQERDQVSLRLEQEARLASSIGHEHIIDITDFGQTEDGRTFVAMEYLEGESLGQLIARAGALEPMRAVRIGRQIAGALGAAHDKGIIHRDVKPDNVFLLQRNGRDFVKVVDFGISKSVLPDADGTSSPRLTQTGMVLGTPLYMSPEQARGDENLDHRIDVYALGVILYEMVTGEVPFSGSNYLNVLSQVISNEPPPPSERAPNLGEDFEAVITKAMAKDREERYANMAELAADLAILESADPRATVSSLGITAARKRATNRSKLRVVWAVAGVAVIAAALVVATTMVLDDPPKRPSRPVAAAVPPRDAAPKPPPPADARAPERATVEVAAIRITSDPEGATVYADGGSRKLGITPFLWKTEKREGDVELIAELDGYDDASFRVSPLVLDGEEVSVRLLEPKSGSQRVRLIGNKTTAPSAPKPTATPPVDKTAGGDLSGDVYEQKLRQQ